MRNYHRKPIVTGYAVVDSRNRTVEGPFLYREDARDAVYRLDRNVEFYPDTAGGVEAARHAIVPILSR